MTATWATTSLLRALVLALPLGSLAGAHPDPGRRAQTGRTALGRLAEPDVDGAARALSFLGLGVQPPNSDWGSMLADGHPYMMRVPGLVIYPGLAVFITALSVTLIGRGLSRWRDRQTWRERNENHAYKIRRCTGAGMNRIKTKEIRATKPTLAAVITTQIRDRVMDGTFAPGTQLNEVELATRFATSRGPIREGMQRLVEEGLLISSPHRGIWVRQLVQADLEDLYFARAAIERAAMLRLIDRGIPAALLARLEQALTRMSLAIEGGQWDQVSAADLQFHELIVQAAHSERLSKMYASLAGQTRLGLPQLVGTYQERSDLLEEHTHLMRLLAAQDRTAAMDALDRHLGAAVATLVADHAGADDSEARRTTSMSE